MDDMRFVYFGRPEQGQHHKGVVCIGYKQEENGLNFAISFCSPKDNFSRPKAHLMLGGRYDKEKREVLEEFSSVEDLKPFETVRETIWMFLNEDGYNDIAGVPVPGWFKRQIKKNQKDVSISA